MHLDGKVALVTGAGSGIGEATAYILAEHGARVGCLSRDADELQQVVDRISQRGGEAIVLTADVSVPEQVQAACDQVAEKWGRMDILFANAGINGVWAPLDELSPDDWNKTIQINLTGTFLTIKYAAPYLKRQGGAIVITSSVNGTRIFSNTGATAYSSTKAAQVALGKMLAVELARDKVRVNIICPGAFESEIQESTETRNVEEVKVPIEYPEGKIPLTRGEPGKPEQIGQLVAFLVSDEAAHITGTELWIDGAESLIVG